MATVAANLMTAEEFFDWVHRPENRDRHFELDKGEIVEMSLPGERHCAVCGNATRIFGNYTFAIGKGYVCSNDMGLILERDPDTVRGPDIALYLEQRRYAELTPKFSERMPALVVEVLSPSDRLGKVLRRVRLYLDRGIAMVWILDPEARNLAIYRPDKTYAVLEENEEIKELEVLPSFHCRVADFFAMSGET